MAQIPKYGTHTERMGKGDFPGQRNKGKAEFNVQVFSWKESRGFSVECEFFLVSGPSAV